MIQGAKRGQRVWAGSWGRQWFDSRLLRAETRRPWERQQRQNPARRQAWFRARCCVTPVRGAAAFAALEPRAGASLAWDEFCLFDFSMSLHGAKATQMHTKVRHGRCGPTFVLGGAGVIQAAAATAADMALHGVRVAGSEPKKAFKRCGGPPRNRVERCCSCSLFFMFVSVQGEDLIFIFE